MNLAAAPAPVETGAFSPLALGLTRGGEAVPAFLACAAPSWARAVEARRGDVLHENELRTYEGLRFERRRDEFLLGRFVAKVALGEYLGERDWATLEVVNGIFQQPLVRHERVPGEPGPPGFPWTPSTRSGNPRVGSSLAAVCLTHSGGAAAAVAFPAAHPLAIDLERLEPDRLGTLQTQVSLAEVDTATLSPDEALRRVTQLWTAKEALSKVLRCGLTTPFEVLAVESVVFRNGSAEGRFRNFGQYRFESSIVGGFAFAIVLPRKSSLGAGVAAWLAERLEAEP